MEYVLSATDKMKKYLSIALMLLLVSFAAAVSFLRSDKQINFEDSKVDLLTKERYLADVDKILSAGEDLYHEPQTFLYESVDSDGNDGRLFAIGSGHPSYLIFEKSSDSSWWVPRNESMVFQKYFEIYKDNAELLKSLPIWLESLNKELSEGMINQERIKYDEGGKGLSQDELLERFNGSELVFIDLVKSLDFYPDLFGGSNGVILLERNPKNEFVSSALLCLYVDSSWKIYFPDLETN